MTWVKVDDQLHSHPKIQDAWQIDPASVGLYLRALSYAGDHLTDGEIRESFVEALFPVQAKRERAVGALLQTGLWEHSGNDYTIHDFLDFNESREEILERRRKDAARKHGRRAYGTA